MGVPRIIFTRFANADSPKLAPWRAHRRRVVGATAETGRTTPNPERLAVVWQLVSANNRELARSADVFDDFQDAVISATEAVDFVASDGAVILTSDERQGSYGWYLSIFGHPAVVCARWYVAERERRHAVALTLKSLPLAEIARGARQYVDSQSVSQRSLV
ncbi:hypothetical protein [Salinibacterium sp. ZJ450]|uniref:hypothetical protein n=1 Tax=Salinibacterium sp. ZJ450 TaxID=2708338 RepID=UPI00141FAC72|nr:hypothetical protein [Salinibacterium sp. ZJ450]